MKLDKNKKLILIIVICILILVLVMLSLTIRPKEKIDVSNYPEGTKARTTSKLKKEHCLDNICLTNVYIYYIDESGTVTFTLENKTNKAKKGYLKMKFDDQYIIIYYEFTGKGKYNSSSTYDGRSFGKVNNYKLVELSDEELKNIK